MICLDTNYLIMGLVSGSREADMLLNWADQGERFFVSAIVWYEFLCGPVTGEQKTAMKALLTEIVPFDDVLAQTAAHLFNQVARSRQLRVDTMIAATAISHKSPLATNNTDDFNRFCTFGLRLITP